MKTPEGYEKDDIDAFLDEQGIWHYRAFTGGFGKSGISDIIACVPIKITSDMVGNTIGAFLAIEVKRERKEPTPIQWARMREIKKACGEALWGTAAKVIPELKKWLRCE